MCNDLTFEECMIPNVEGSDMKGYVVHTSVITHEQLKAYKPMEMHNYRTSGFVRTHLKEFGDNVIMRGKFLVYEGCTFKICEIQRCQCSPLLILWNHLCQLFSYEMQSEV